MENTQCHKNAEKNLGKAIREPIVKSDVFHSKFQDHRLFPA
jgi:hypothetical protein